MSSADTLTVKLVNSFCSKEEVDITSVASAFGEKMGSVRRCLTVGGERKAGQDQIGPLPYVVRSLQTVPPCATPIRFTTEKSAYADYRTRYCSASKCLVCNDANALCHTSFQGNLRALRKYLGRRHHARITDALRTLVWLSRVWVERKRSKSFLAVQRSTWSALIFRFAAHPFTQRTSDTGKHCL